MVGYLPHCTFNLNPRAASIDTPLHAYVPRAHVDHMHPDAIIAIAASKDSKALTREIFGDEIGWLPWKRPGLRARPLAGEVLPREPRRARRRAGEPRPLHLGRRRQGLLRDHARDHQPRDRLARERDRRQARLRRRGARRRCPPEERRARRRGADAGDPRHDLRQDARKVGHFDDQHGGAGVRRRRRTWRPWRRSAPAARTISCAPRSGRWWWTSTPPKPGPRRRRSPACRRRSRPTARTTPPTTSAAGARTARRCATRTRWSTWCPASA